MRHILFEVNEAVEQGCGMVVETGCERSRRRLLEEITLQAAKGQFGLF